MLGSLYGDLPAAAGKKAPPGAGLYDGLTGDTPAPAPFAAAARSSPPPAAEPAPSPTAAAEMEKRRRIEEEKLRKANEPKQEVKVEPKEDDFATKMLKKMGWKDGQGLGKDGQGITAPLMARKTDKNVAVIEQAPTKPAAPKPTPGTNFNRQPTRVVMLTNMVGKGEIDEDLADETKDEAGKYGEIKSVKCVDVPNARDDQAVRIFINFSTAESATKALLGFNGRFFGGRTVLARFFSPDLYDKGDYLADPQAG